jgi:predicted O-methyltransferase YrrM
MQKIDALVVGAMELAQIPVSLKDLQAFLPADHVFLELWPQIADAAILHPLQALNIVERLDYVLQKHQPGDVIECGVFQGVTSVLMAKLMDLRQSDKKLFLFDSFQGLPEPDRQVDASLRFQKGGWAASRKEVEALLAKYNVLQRCVIHEGWFSETLPKLKDDQQFCFAYIDADLYSSTVDCLKHIWKRMGQNSVAVFDDYHHPSGGVRKALDEWVGASGELIHVGAASQCFVVRGIRADNQNFSSFLLETGNNKEIAISFDYLRSNKLFCALVNRRLTNLRALEARLGEFAGLLGTKT